MATRQTFCGVSTPTSGSTVYYAATRLRRAAAVENQVSSRWLDTSRARALRVQASAVPGAGKERIVTFRLDGADTLLTVRLGPTDDDVTAEVDVAITNGQLISVSHFATAGTATHTLKITLVIDHSTARISCYGGLDQGDVIPSINPHVAGVFTAAWENIGIVLKQNVIPTGCVIETIGFDLDVAPGMGESIDFDFYLNDAIIGSLSIADTDTSGEVDLDLDLAQNDRVVMAATRTSAPSDMYARPYVRVRADHDGESLICWDSSSQFVAATTRYNPYYVWTQTATESDIQVGSAYSSFSLKKLSAIVVDAQVFDLDECQITLRKNAADTGLTLTTPAVPWLPAQSNAIANPNNTVIVAVAPDDLMDMAITMAGGGAMNITMAMVQAQFASPVVGTIGPHVWLEWPDASA